MSCSCIRSVWSCGRQGLLSAEGSENGHAGRPGASPLEEAETWLTVSCRDRHGVLADVAVTIAKYNLNIVVRPLCPSCPFLPPVPAVVIVRLLQSVSEL